MSDSPWIKARGPKPKDIYAVPLWLQVIGGIVWLCGLVMMLGMVVALWMMMVA